MKFHSLMFTALLSIGAIECANAAMTAPQTCPPANQVFVVRGNQTIPIPPQGWQFTKNWPSHLDSTNVNFSMAAWGADLHTPTDSDNHVRCYYGNPDLSPKHGVAIESIDVVAESAIVNHAEWSGGNHYFLCHVNACPFN